MPSFTKPFLVILFLIFSVRGYSAIIRGHVYDRSSKEQLIGASVAITSLQKGVVSELDGSFILKDIAPGNYSVNISYIGYESSDTNITVTENNQVVRLEVSLLPKSQQMKQVEIKSTANGGSDAYANRAEQKSISLVNIISAKAIQISPDITVANVMQRVSGVVMDKGNSGEARYAVIRGMEKKYNTTLVNGVKIPSPNDKDRYVPLDIFPAELLERLEVIKTLMPGMEGDGTGGVVNMVMKNAPDKLMVEAGIGAGYSDIFQNRDFLKFDSKVSLKSPAELSGPNVGAVPSDFPYKNLITSPVGTPANSTASLTIGNRYFKNKLGVILAGSFQNTFRGTNSDVLVQNATITPSTGPTVLNTQSFSDILVRQYSTRYERTGVEAKMDYSLNDNNSLALFAVYTQLNEYRVRSTIDSTLGGYHINNYIGPFSLSDELQTRQTRQSIYSATLQGKHTLTTLLSADWSLVASEAVQKMPDIASFSTSQDVNPNVAAQTFTLSPPVVGDESRIWEHNTDKDLAGYVNFHYLTDLIPGLTKIDIGGLYRHKERDNYYNEYKLKASPDSGSTNEAYSSIAASQFFFSTNAQFGNGYQNGGTYNFTENISAYYLQLHYEIGRRIKFDGGARIENTDQSYASSAPVNLAGKYGTFIYSDFLPSVQGKYEINTKSAIRLSYFKSIYRPAYADLVPFVDPNANEIFPVQGDPTIQHTTVDNYDLRYELFPKGLDQLLVGVFYKYLTNPIEYGLVEQGFSAGEVLSPENAAHTAHNAGLELVYRKFIGNFGVSVNYTYTSSDIASPQRIYWANAASGTHYDTVYPHRPLQGQAANIGNLSFLYKDGKRKIESQLAFVYTGERIYTLSGYDGLNNWEKPTLNLDFSAQKGIGKHFTVFFKANNLLNTPFELIIKQPNAAYAGDSKLPFQESGSYSTVQKDLYYRTFLLGLRYKI